MEAQKAFDVLQQRKLELVARYESEIDQLKLENESLKEQLENVEKEEKDNSNKEV